MPRSYKAYTISVIWTDGRAHDYEGYRSRELVGNHFNGFKQQAVVRRLHLWGVNSREDMDLIVSWPPMVEVPLHGGDPSLSPETDTAKGA